MTYRERFEKTLQHQAVDRAPIDFCGTPLTGCHGDVIRKLTNALSIQAADENEAIEKLQTAFDCDFRKVGAMLEPPSVYTDYSRMEQGEYVDCWGITRTFQGLYWEISKNPFRDLSLEELQDYQWPKAEDIDESVFTGFAEQAKRLYYDTDYVVIGEHPVFGFFELGCWMFGFDDFLYRLLGEPETVEWFFSRYAVYVEAINELYYGAIGPYIHATTSGDDFGTQGGPFMSPDTFRECVKPWYARRIRNIKQYTKAAFFHHTCGSVFRLLDDIVDMGVDILNPIQPGAMEMAPERLREHFGDKLTFWGGIDEQKLLSSGTPEQVAEEVRRVLRIMQPGGYVVAPSHNIQPDVPAENIISLYKTARNG